MRDKVFNDKMEMLDELSLSKFSDAPIRLMEREIIVNNLKDLSISQFMDICNEAKEVFLTTPTPQDFIEIAKRKGYFKKVSNKCIYCNGSGQLWAYYRHEKPQSKTGIIERKPYAFRCKCPAYINFANDDICRRFIVEDEIDNFEPIKMHF